MKLIVMMMVICPIWKLLVKHGEEKAHSRAINMDIYT